MEDAKGSSTNRRGPLLERVPSWAFLALLAAIVLLLWLLTLVNREVFFNNFVDKYLWRPLVEDEGYNVVNTIGLFVVLACILGWAYRLMSEFKETVDIELTVAVVPYLVWGSIYRVLEDSDLFAPFREDIETATRTVHGGSACVPEVGGTFLHQCFGVFFITPIIYVVVTFIAVFFLWLGLHARRVAQRRGAAYGLRFFTLTLVGWLALYLALYASDQTFIRFVPSPLVALAAALLAFAIVWADTRRRGTVNARWCMFAYSMLFFVVGTYYVLVWMTGGQGEWAPRQEVTWWVFIALILAPLLVALSSASKGRIFSGEVGVTGARPRFLNTPGKPAAVLAGILVVEGLAVFAALVAFDALENRLVRGILFDDIQILLGIVVLLAIGPAAYFLGNRLARFLATGTVGVHAALIFFANPVNVIMVFGQAADALMTALGIDVFGLSEKHVLPGYLISVVDGLGLPGFLGDYPATLVMVPLKILIVLGVVWLIDIASRSEAGSRQNLIGLVKMAIIMVGLSPAVRNATRLAMGT